MTKKVIVNADDFGISLGVKNAIETMINEDRLNSVSIFAKAKYTKEAIDFCKKNPQISAGLHFNLTTGPSVLGHKELPILTDANNNFKLGFIGLLLAVIKNNGIVAEVDKELNAQLDLLKDLPISHVDGHRHVHFIPRIFSAVNNIAKIRKISRVRVINESVIKSLFCCKNISFLFDGGIIKLIILRLCGLFNGSYKIKSPYFFSILYTGKITSDLVKNLKVPFGFHEMEIMIHPGDNNIDKNEDILYEKEALLSDYRNKESEFKL